MSLLTGNWGPTGRASGLRGTGYKQITSPTLNPGQMDLFNQLLGNVQSGLGQGGLSQLSRMASGDQSQFAQMEAPALRQFGELQGNLASRFSGLGSGARQSSGFQNTMGEAASDLAERLQSQRLGFQQQALAQLLGLSESLLGKETFNTALVAKKKPFWKDFLGSAAGGVGQGLGMLPKLFM